MEESKRFECFTQKRSAGLKNNSLSVYYGLMKFGKRRIKLMQKNQGSQMKNLEK
jgi:hypothetical protein